MIRLLTIALLALLTAMPTHTIAADPASRTLTVRGQRLTVEVVSTPETRAIGLMNRFSLPTDHGMLFVFEAPEPQSFWMKNTYIPLSIAFVDARGRILNIEDMRPQDETPHTSKGLALYAIEMRQGWFVTRGIGAGDVVEGLPASPP